MPRDDIHNAKNCNNLANIRIGQVPYKYMEGRRGIAKEIVLICPLRTLRMGDGDKIKKIAYLTYQE